MGQDTPQRFGDTEHMLAIFGHTCRESASRVHICRPIDRVTLLQRLTLILFFLQLAQAVDLATPGIATTRCAGLRM
jgi:hypothetical protein